MMEPVNSIGYEQEIEGVDHIPFALSKIFDFHKRKKKKNEKEYSPSQVILSGCLVLFVIGVLIYAKEIITFAKDAINKVILEESGTDIEWPELEPLIFDMETYINDVNVFMTTDSFWIRNYNDYEALHEHVGMVLPESELLSYTNIRVAVSRMKKYGEIEMTVTYQDKKYYLHGRFGVKNLTPEYIALSFELVPEKASYTYDYAGDKKAYFIDKIGEDNQNIYFEAGDVLYCMSVMDTEASISSAKELIDIMSMK